MFERIVRSVFVLTIATVTVAVGSSAVLSASGSVSAKADAALGEAATTSLAEPSIPPIPAVTRAPVVQVAAPERHSVSTAAVSAPVHAAVTPKPRIAPKKPAARPVAATISVWTSGFQAQLNACRGAVDLTGAYRVPTIGEKWTCGGARFPRAGSLVRLTGLHAGLYRVGPVVAMLNAYTQNSGAIPHGYALLFQTCVNDNAHTESFTALTRVG